MRMNTWDSPQQLYCNTPLPSISDPISCTQFQCCNTQIQTQDSIQLSSRISLLHVRNPCPHQQRSPNYSSSCNSPAVIKQPSSATKSHVSSVLASCCKRSHHLRIEIRKIHSSFIFLHLSLNLIIIPSQLNINICNIIIWRHIILWNLHRLIIPYPRLIVIIHQHIIHTNIIVGTIISRWYLHTFLVPIYRLFIIFFSTAITNTYFICHTNISWVI